MPHEVLQGLRVHSRFCHIGAIGVSAHMRRDIWHLHPVDVVVSADHMIESRGVVLSIINYLLSHFQVLLQLQTIFLQQKIINTHSRNAIFISCHIHNILNQNYLFKRIIYIYP